MTRNIMVPERIMAHATTNCRILGSCHLLSCRPFSQIRRTRYRIGHFQPVCRFSICLPLISSSATFSNLAHSEISWNPKAREMEKLDPCYDASSRTKRTVAALSYKNVSAVSRESQLIVNNPRHLNHLWTEQLLFRNIPFVITAMQWLKTSQQTYGRDVGMLELK